MDAFMSKAEATRLFKEQYSDVIESDDIPAIREAWHVFLDELHKDGSINYHRIYTWVNPVLKPKDR